MEIYKVIALDICGKQVAEFGYYEERDDANGRLLEILKGTSYNGTFEVKDIAVKPKAQPEEKKDYIEHEEYYELK